jgi:hypothetical protein
MVSLVKPLKIVRFRMFAEMQDLQEGSGGRALV